MHNLFLLTGSNVGNSMSNLALAKQFIERNIGQTINQSGIYKTEPWGNQQQDFFLNQVLEIKTSLSALEVLKHILAIETQMGRVRLTKWEPRVIDIDILYVGQHIIKETNLIVPHPLMHQRRFTLIPLAEIAPQFIHPIFNVSNTELLHQCNDDGEVEKI